MRVVYEKGNIRKVQYAQNDDGAWFCRTTGGKNLAARWSRCHPNFTLDTRDYVRLELPIRLPGGPTEM